MAWRVPMSPAQAKSRGFYHGPSDELPWTNDLLWKNHIKQHEKTMAHAATRPPSAATSAAAPWGIQYDATMQVWSPFSNRAEIHHLRPRTALLEFRKVLASNPTSSKAWEAEHGRRNVFRVLERHSQDSPLFQPGAVAREVEWADNLAGAEGIEKMKIWAEERAQQRRQEREDGFERVGSGWIGTGSGTHRSRMSERTRRPSEELLAFERQPGTSAYSAARSAWQHADRNVDKTEHGKNKHLPRRRHKDSIQGPYELLLGRQAAYKESWADHGAATIGKSSAVHVSRRDPSGTKTMTSPSEVESLEALQEKRRQTTSIKKPFRRLLEEEAGERHRGERYAGASVTDQRGNVFDERRGTPPVGVNSSVLSTDVIEPETPGALSRDFLRTQSQSTSATPASRPRPHIQFVGPTDNAGRPVIMVKRAKAISVPQTNFSEPQPQLLAFPSRGSTPVTSFMAGGARIPVGLSYGNPPEDAMPEWAVQMQRDIQDLKRERAAGYTPDSSLAE